MSTPEPSSIAAAEALTAELEEDPRGTWVTWETVDAYALARELGLEPGNVFVVFDEVDPARLYDASG